AAIETIEQQGLLERARTLGELFRRRLNALRDVCPLVRSVRAVGLMLGIELAIEGTPIVAACLERRLLINCTHNTVIRLLPAMTLTEEQVEEGCDILADVLSNACD
ncbi:MAG: aminotransferase class III-fold pyridoxal phosphate-dependent enzyme, partial [Planctomycetes bacterium]|nr:aminotransferase class III-fold pyridoxal phosphate-dependent enzyme [Planctomycetota bacterium]